MRRIQKTIDQFISDGPLPAVKPDDPVTAAMEAMKAHRSDCALVLDGGTVVGIFTERDFLNRVTVPQRTPTETTLREVMTTEPETLHPHDAIEYAINRMVERGFRNIPIVDDSGKAVAVLDVRDVMAHLSELFDEVAEGRRVESEGNEWTDIGGG